jgi:hypothetical protein
MLKEARKQGVVAATKHQNTASEPMARVSKMTRGNISLVRGIHCCPNSFLLPYQNLYIVKSMCIYVHTHLQRDCI